LWTTGPSKPKSNFQGNNRNKKKAGKTGKRCSVLLGVHLKASVGFAMGEWAGMTNKKKFFKKRLTAQKR